jgi:WD40 repeat protein
VKILASVFHELIEAFAVASATSCHFPSGSSSCAVTASTDGCVKIWDIKTARAIAQPEGTTHKLLLLLVFLHQSTSYNHLPQKAADTFCTTFIPRIRPFLTANSSKDRRSYLLPVISRLNNCYVCGICYVYTLTS